MCVYICIYIYIAIGNVGPVSYDPKSYVFSLMYYILYTYTHTRSYMCIYMDHDICALTYVYVCIHTRSYVYIYNIHTLIYVCVQVSWREKNVELTPYDHNFHICNIHTHSYMYIYNIHTHINTYTICTHSYVYTHAHIYIQYTHTHTGIYKIYTYSYMYMHSLHTLMRVYKHGSRPARGSCILCVHIYECVYTYICTHTYRYTHTHIYTYTHIQTYILGLRQARWSQRPLTQTPWKWCGW